MGVPKEDHGKLNISVSCIFNKMIGARADEAIIRYSECHLIDIKLAFYLTDILQVTWEKVRPGLDMYLHLIGN